VETQFSVIILSYNTKDLTKRCIWALIKNLKTNNNFHWEIIILDNASSDRSGEMLKKIEKENKEIKVILSKKNLGFAKGNNEAFKTAKGRFVLYYNSDVIVQDINFEKLIGYLDQNPDIGGLTVKVNLTDGNIDPASHRGFPTLRNSFFYFLGLEKLTKNIPLLNKMFGGYHLTHLDLKSIHEIDSPTGAFFLVKKSILDKLGGFDEDFFFFGEDLDLSFRIKKLGYKIMYYPLFEVLHLKHASSGDNKKKIKTKSMTRYHFYDAMKIFYEKHYEIYNPKLVNVSIYFLLNILKNKHAQNRN